MNRIGGARWGTLLRESRFDARNLVFSALQLDQFPNTARREGVKRISNKYDAGTKLIVATIAGSRRGYGLRLGGRNFFVPWRIHTQPAVGFPCPIGSVAGCKGMFLP
jgi:hypothetical protein